MRDLDYSTLKECLLEDEFYGVVLTEEEIDEFIENLKKGEI